MSDFRDNFYRQQPFLYKLVIFILTTVLMVYLFPKKGKFKYQFSVGKPWQYENLYAPFDFGILKSEDDISKEKEALQNEAIPYFDIDTIVASRVQSKLKKTYVEVFKDSIFQEKEIYQFISRKLEKIYESGILDKRYTYSNDKQVYKKTGNTVSAVTYGSFLQMSTLSGVLTKGIDTTLFPSKDKLLFLFYEIVEPNVKINTLLTEETIDEALAKVLITRGSVEKDARIIAKGETVDSNKFQILKSLQLQYESELWSKSNKSLIILGYSLLVALAMMMLFLFIRKYRSEVYENTTKLTFVLFNMLLMVLLTTLVVKFNPIYVYVVPICILPLIIKAFFDARLGLFTHVITVLILGFIVPNSFEYMFLQIIAGIVTILTVSELYKRANLFISVGQITLVYFLAFLAFHFIQQGGLESLEELRPLLFFILCGFATLIVHPLIYGFEKIFGLVSDVSLLELSDTNSELLKELSNKAPGTFHHSLNVANIAEAAANEVGANAMLVRVGALYHDVGKTKNPTFFTENQVNGVNPHDNLSPQESAKVIVGHTINGIEIAKKYKLPDRVIDFIRTHHGTSKVYYFLKKAQEENPEVDISEFQYPGPIPFSKETAILMMADSVEAASKSLQQPTSSLIDNFVEKIIDKQMSEGQFLNADITFKEIQQIKKVMKRKLNNIYHLRVEYPE